MAPFVGLYKLKLLNDGQRPRNSDGKTNTIDFYGMTMTAKSPAPIVVFDLDGTLLDTAPDLVEAVNTVLVTAGGKAVEEDWMRPNVSFGGREMIRRGLIAQGIESNDEELGRLFEEFVGYYSKNISAKTQPFPGLFDELARLKELGVKLAVCTNKMEGLTWPLLEQMEMTHWFAAVTGRDTFPVSKPDPRHLLGTIARAGGDPNRAVMIGDSNTDIKTAKAAGIPVVAVTFGYTDVPVTELGPDRVISHYDQLQAALDQLMPAS
ncbi:MAG: phosphoglycolate phosphatase [Pseudomonadota bacterium]